MHLNIAAVVLGVRQEVGNELHPQVVSCLKRAKTILDGKGTHFILPLGGEGHGPTALFYPESDLLAAHLINEMGVERHRILPYGSPTTTPEAIWELRGLAPLHEIYWVRIVTIEQRLERIQFLCDLLLPHLQVSFDVVEHKVQPEERHTLRHETHLLKEAKTMLAGMEPGDAVEFCRRWSFRYHLWRDALPGMRERGELAQLLP